MNDECQYCGRVLQDQELPLNLPPGRDLFCSLGCKDAHGAEVATPEPDDEDDEPAAA